MKNGQKRTKKEIIINATINEVRVAITEDGNLAEFFIELQEYENLVGSIYLGKVNKIVQGINAAFIDVGLKNDAFLHFSDVDESMENIILDEEDEEEKQEIQQKKTRKKPKEPDSASVALRKVKPSANKKLVTFQTKSSGEVHINLEPKQDVIVQVVREAYSNKGVKVTTKIALPGRYLVLLPFDKIVGASRKITSFQERKRLRRIARRLMDDDYGCILRTAAKGKSEEEISKDFENLLEIWKGIEKKVEKNSSPALLYQDLHLASSIIRDLFSTEVDKVIIDSKKLFKEIIGYLKDYSPHLIDKVILHNDSTPVFEKYGVEKELSNTYKKKVFLKSGGSIVFDQTEAMVVIDVNSGRSSEREQERNAYKTNFEAAKEIAKQLRLRDIGGMIVIDFIDMMEESNRKKLFFEMKNELSRDRTKFVVYPLTQLGLLQITRQRTNQNIVEKISETCSMCNGTGRVTSKIVVLNNIERWLKNFRSNCHEFRLILYIHPNFAEYLTEGTISRLSKLMFKYFVKIKVQQNDTVSINSFKFYSVKRQKDITSDYL